MNLAEYPDEDLIEEIKHRGIKIEVRLKPVSNLNEFVANKKQVLIGGVTFDIK